MRAPLAAGRLIGQTCRGPFVGAVVSCCAVLLLVAAAHETGSGRRLPRTSYAQPLRGQFVFVMLAAERPDDAGEYLSERYPASGLYRVGETAPLWTADFYVYRSAQGPMLDPTGRYLARVNPDDARPDTALVFYDSGAPVKAVSVHELVIFPDRFGWLERTAYDPEAGRVTIHTTTGGRHVFDIATGLRLESSRPRLWWLLGALAALVALANTAIRWRRGRWPEPVAWFVQAGLLACAAALL